MFKCLVTHIIDPHNLWCHIGTEDSFEEWSKFEDRINNFALSELNNGREADIDNLEQGSLILAKCAKRRKWMRAVVHSINCDELMEIDVLFHDYQYSEIVEPSRVIDYVPEWIQSCAPQAVRGCLFDVNPIASSWVTRTYTFLNNKLLGEVLDAQCVDIKTNHNVTVYTLDIFAEGEDGPQSVSDMLVEQGLAMPRPKQTDQHTIKHCKATVPKFNIEKLTLSKNARAQPKQGYDMAAERDYEREAFCSQYDTNMLDMRYSDLRIGTGISNSLQASESIHKMIEDMKNSIRLKGHSSPVGPRAAGRGGGRGRRNFYDGPIDSSPEPGSGRKSSPSGQFYRHGAGNWGSGDARDRRRADRDEYSHERSAREWSKDNRAAKNSRHMNQSDQRHLPPRLRRLKERERSYSGERYHSDDQSYTYQGEYEDSEDRNNDPWNRNHYRHNSGGSWNNKHRPQEFRESRNESRNFRPDARKWDQAPGANRKQNNDERSRKREDFNDSNSSDKNWRKTTKPWPDDLCSMPQSKSDSILESKHIVQEDPTHAAEQHGEYNMWSDPQPGMPVRWSDWHEDSVDRSSQEFQWNDATDDNKATNSREHVIQNEKGRTHSGSSKSTDNGAAAEQQEHWDDGNISFRVNKVLGNARADNVEDMIQELHTVVSSEESESIVKSREHCLHAVTQWAVETKQFDIPLSIMHSFSDKKKFIEVMCSVLMSLQSDYVKVNSRAKHNSKNNANEDSTKEEKKHEIYAQLLGKIYIHAHNWPDSDDLIATIVKISTKWAVFNKHKQHSRPGPLYELYADCLSAFLNVASQHMTQHRPRDVAAIVDDIRGKVLDADVPRKVREKLLSSMDTLSAVQNRPQSSVPQQKPAVPSVDCATQTYISTRDVGCDQNDPAENQTVSNSEKPSDDRSDPYHQVSEMLRDLGLKELFEVFTENGIRDSVLEQEWTELKPLLKECGVKAGEILEIKTYLAKSQPGTARREGNSSVDSVTSSHSSSTLYSSKDDVTNAQCDVVHKSTRQSHSSSNQNNAHSSATFVKKPQSNVSNQRHGDKQLNYDSQEKRDAHNKNRSQDRPLVQRPTSVIPASEFQHPEIPAVFHPSPGYQRSVSGSHHEAVSPARHDRPTRSASATDQPYYPHHEYQNSNSRAHRQLFAPDSCSHKTKQQAMLEDSFTPAYVLKQMSRDSDESSSRSELANINANQSAYSQESHDYYGSPASHHSQDVYGHERPASNQSHDRYDYKESANQSRGRYANEHHANDMSPNYARRNDRAREYSPNNGREQKSHHSDSHLKQSENYESPKSERRLSEASDTQSENRPRKYNVGGFKNLVDDWLSRNENSPASPSVSQDSQTTGVVSPRSYLPPPPPPRVSVPPLPPSRDSSFTSSTKQKNESRLQPKDLQSESDLEKPEYVCNPVEYPSLSESSAALKKNGQKSSQTDNEPESPRTQMENYQQHYRVKYKIPDNTQTKLAASRFGSKGRVCSWCGSNEHHPDLCPNKTQNYFFNNS